MIGWSAEFQQGEVRPLRYFGEDLVAYRDESGELHVLSGHCRHLGAHIGHGGKVVGDCVECPFHGWRWGPDGTNRYIPYQRDRPNKALRLRVYPVREQYGCVFVWHQPDGKDPQWEMPDLFHKFPQFDTDPNAYYRPYPEFSSRAEREPVHPQIVAENGPDSAHFHYVHGATVTPVCLNWEAVEEEWRFLTGWPDARSDDPNKMEIPQFDTDPNAYYRPYPEFSSRAEREPVHPQIVAENGPDSAHFHYVHGATVTPVCLNWEAVEEEWRFLTGWPDARSDDPNKM